MSSFGTRIGFVIGLTIAVAAGAHAGEVPTRALPPPPAPGPLEKTLSPADVMRYFDADYLPQVRDCYLEHVARGKGATGRFTIGLIIRPVGTVLALTLRMQGPNRAGFETCVRTASEDWHFPDRGGFTAVEIPVIFVRTRAPGAGPMKK
jgi:hypothetical protein